MSEQSKVAELAAIVAELASELRRVSLGTTGLGTPDTIEALVARAKALAEDNSDSQ